MYISINVLSNYFTLQSAKIISSIPCNSSDRTKYENNFKDSDYVLRNDLSMPKKYLVAAFLSNGKYWLHAVESSFKR
jgi:hypothetical protein